MKVWTQLSLRHWAVGRVEGEGLEARCLLQTRLCVDLRCLLRVNQFSGPPP